MMVIWAVFPRSNDSTKRMKYILFPTSELPVVSTSDSRYRKFPLTISRAYRNLKNSLLSLWNRRHSRSMCRSEVNRLVPHTFSLKTRLCPSTYGFVHGLEGEPNSGVTEQFKRKIRNFPVVLLPRAVPLIRCAIVGVYLRGLF